ncbi:MAG: hypothetical protein QJR08_07095 [Bacillota bacterium]|nr:hypothetical protein [Bacillota bacterium]
MARVGRTLAVLGAAGAFVAGGAAALRQAPGVVQAAPSLSSSPSPALSTSQLAAVQSQLAQQVTAEERSVASLNQREQQLEQALAAAQQQLQQELAAVAAAKSRLAQLQALQLQQQQQLQQQTQAQTQAPSVDTVTGASSSRGSHEGREHQGDGGFWLFGSGEGDEGSEGWGQ